MHIRNTDRPADKIELQMTPMIDIVFQLLVFFIMTFKIVSQEGDFNIKMPLAAPQEGLPDDEQLVPMKVRLRSDANGNLAGISFVDRNLANWEELHNEVITYIGDDSGPTKAQESAEVELDCDYNLRYEHVIQAITAVSGYVDPNGDIVKLVEKIKFAPPRTDGGIE